MRMATAGRSVSFADGPGTAGGMASSSTSSSSFAPFFPSSAPPLLPSSASPSFPAELTPTEQSFLALCRQHPEGLYDEMLTGMSLKEKADVINGLSRKSLITFVRQSNGHIAYQEVKPADVHRMATLNPDEKLVYLLIKQADNKGIWTRDIRSRSVLQHSQVTKILKVLESKKVVKSVKSVEVPAFFGEGTWIFSR